LSTGTSENIGEAPSSAATSASSTTFENCRHRTLMTASEAAGFLRKRRATSRAERRRSPPWAETRERQGQEEHSETSRVNVQACWCKALAQAMGDPV